MNPPPFAHSSPSHGASRVNSDPLEDLSATEWERNYSMAMHLSLLASVIGVPLVPVIVLYLLKKDVSPFVADHGREAVNFQISLLIYALISLPLFFICGLGIVSMTATYVLGLVGMIFAAVAARSGRYYRYPACIRFLSPRATAV